VSRDAAEVMLHPGVRVEFVSRYWVRARDGFLFSFPKLPKFIASLAVTFSTGDVPEVAASGMAAAMLNTTHSSLLYKLSRALHSYWRAKGASGDIRGNNYVERVAMLTAQVEGAPSVMEYIEREYRAAQPYHHEGHEFLAREYPNLSIEEQQCLEDTLVAAHEGAAASPEWAWSAIGTVVARLTEVARHLEG